MTTTFSIIAVIVLLGLLAVSAKRQREQRLAQKEAVARAHSTEADAQYERSQRRRDEVRAAHAQRADAEAPGTDAQKTVSAADK